MQPLAADFAADNPQFARPLAEIRLRHCSKHMVGIEDQVAIPLEGNAELLTELCIHGVAFYIHLAAQRIGMRSNAGVNHAVVAGGRVHGHVAFLIKQQDIERIFGKLAGDCAADHAAADDEHIRPAALQRVIPPFRRADRRRCEAFERNIVDDAFIARLCGNLSGLDDGFPIVEFPLQPDGFTPLGAGNVLVPFAAQGAFQLLSRCHGNHLSIYFNRFLLWKIKREMVRLSEPLDRIVSIYYTFVNKYDGFRLEFFGMVR